MSIDDFEDEELEWLEEDFDFDLEEGPIVEIKNVTEDMKAHEERLHKQGEEVRKKMLADEANLCGPIIFNPQDLVLP